MRYLAARKLYTYISTVTVCARAKSTNTANARGIN